MKSVWNEAFVYEVLSVVEEIPAGKVASYSQIAQLIGRAKNARLVGRALHQAVFKSWSIFKNTGCP